MKHYFLTILVAMSVTSSMAQFSLSGKITTTEGRPLEGANVFVEKLETGTVTNHEGRFTLTNLPENEELVTVYSYLGFRPEKRTIVLKNDYYIEIQLETQAYTAQEVIVSALRASENTPVSHHTIDYKTIKEKNSGQEIPYLLQLTPSLVASSDAGTGIGYSSFRIRGVDMTRINITINDIPLNDAESHSVFLVNMPDFIESVNSIQIQRGVGTSSNGAAAFGASVNMQTNSLSHKAFAEINNVFGAFNTRKHTLKAGTGLLDNNFAFDIRVSQITSNGFIDRATADLKSLHASGGYYSDKHIVKANITLGKQITYLAWNGVPKVKLENDTVGMRHFAEDSGFSPEETENLFTSNSRTYNLYMYENQVDDYKQDHYQLFYTYIHNQNLTANVALHYTQGFGFYESYKYNKKLSSFSLPNMQIGDTLIKRTDLINRKYLDNDFYGAIASVKYKTEKTDITLGGGLNQYLGGHFGEILWTKHNDGSLKPNHEYYRNNATKNDANIYLKSSIKLGQMIDLYGDLQLRGIKYTLSGIEDDNNDISQQHNFLFFNPKAGVFIHKGKLSGFFSIAQAHREPTRSNYTDADTIKGAPTFEKLLDWEAGFSYKSNILAAQVNFFHMQYKDQLVLTGNVNATGYSIMENVDKSYRHGIELSLLLKPHRIIDWTLFATFSRNKINQFVAYFDDWDTYAQRTDTLKNVDISFSPSTVFGSILTVKPIKNLDITLTDNFVGKQYIDNTASTDRQLNKYWVTNLRISYLLTTKLFEVSFFTQINNLYNVDYITNAWVYTYYYNNELRTLDGYFPQAYRHFMVGLNLSF